MRGNRTAVVTGAEGFIGSHLVPFLAAQGWNVIGSHRLHGAQLPLDTPGVQYVQCDLSNGQRVGQVVAEFQPSHIFHLGAQSLPTVSWADPAGTFEANVMGSLYVLEAARRMKKPPVVVSACSSAEYGNVDPSNIPVKEDHALRPLHPYGISKVCLDLLGRQYFLDFRIPTVNIRLFNTTGPGKTSDAPSDFVRQLIRIRKGLQKPVIEVGNLKPKRAFLDVSDTVQGFYLAALRGKRGEAYNLCASRTYEIGEMLEMAMRLSGVQAEIRPARRLIRPSDERVIFGDTRKMRRDTGWRPHRTLRQTLQAMLKHWELAM